MPLRRLFRAAPLHRALNLDRCSRFFCERRAVESPGLPVTVLGARNGNAVRRDVLAEAGKFIDTGGVCASRDLSQAFDIGRHFGIANSSAATVFYKPKKCQSILFMIVPVGLISARPDRSPGPEVDTQRNGGDKVNRRAAQPPEGHE